MVFTELCKDTILQYADHEGSTVSPLLFGANLEHTRSCIHRGLSAQMLENRKFAGKPCAGSGHAARWYPIGERAVFAFDAPYTRHHEMYHMHRKLERNSQRVLNAHAGAAAGIGQHEIQLEQGRRYRFRAVVRTSAPVILTVALTSRHGATEYAACGIKAQGNEWTSYEAALVSPVSDADADLRITFSEKASLAFGALSLMPEDAFHGMRRDVIESLKELGIRLLRWPGGNFAGEYNWADGLLECDMRAPFESCLGIETQPHTMGYDFHEINTDDFIALCREIGAEPFITINPCWNTPAESAKWVEYANGDETTEYGRLRISRGFREPYNVKYWSLGNEFGYGHMEGENTPSGYRKIAQAHAEEMLKVSPGLRLCSSGPYPNADWAENSARELLCVSDLVSQHFYAHIPAYPDAENFKDEYEKTISDVLTLRALLHRNRQELPQSARISMDEWNVWYAWYRPSSVTDGIFAALTLHMLMSEASALKIGQACHFEAVNEGLLFVHPSGSRLTAQGQAFKILKSHIGGKILYAGIDALATEHNGKIIITAVNPSYDRAKTVSIPAARRPGSAVLHTSDEVLPPSRFHETPASCTQTQNAFLYTLPPHSLLKIECF